MDLSDLIQVAPLLLIHKKPTRIKKSKSWNLGSASTAKTRTFKNTRCGQSENDMNTSSENTENSQSSKDMNTETGHSHDAVIAFRRKATERLKLQKNKKLKQKRNDWLQMRDTNKRMNEGKDSVKMAMQNAQKRISRRQMKLEEESDRISDSIKEEKENYARKQEERENTKLEEEQKRARIYALNYLYRTKYQLLCQQKQPR